MKVAIFCGGLGTRFGNITKDIPKPLIEVGGFPILFHVMKIYADQGFTEFVLLLGYRQKLIKDWFNSLVNSVNDYTLDLQSGGRTYTSSNFFDWKITFLDTGVGSNTSNRLWKARNLLSEDDFLLTYADGVANINLRNLIQVHKLSKRLVTMTAVDEPSRLGHVEIENDLVRTFIEKPNSSGNLVNAGFFVVSRDIFSLPVNLFSENSSWEMGPLQYLTNCQELSVYKHNGYWRSMDSERDRDSLSQDLNAINRGMNLFDSYE